MKELHVKALKAYIDMLTIHIQSKSMDTEFHKQTEEFYETLFKVTHEIWERHVDLGESLSDDSLAEMHRKSYDIIVNLKKEIEDYKENNKVSLGCEDLLWTLASDLEDAQGSSRAFL